MQANLENFKLNPAVAVGEALPVDRYSFKTIHIKPGVGGSYTLDISLDGTNWTNFAGPITTETVLTTEDVVAPLPKAVGFMRFVTNAVGASPFANLFGHDPA